MRKLTIPGYEVWGLLGEGGMSEVWLAKHNALGVPVVIKTLRRHLRPSTPAADRILSEARLMARVSSPRIVRALDAGHVVDEGQSTPFLVQEYVDGLDFAELDGRRRAALGVGMPLWSVCRAMREVCLALRAAHQAGVVHRDLKPSNVFGEPELGIRLGDFGIAVARSETSHPEGAGTPAFMAPEQLKSGEVGRYTDVWGAGATACDLRYGHPPFANLECILDPEAPPRLPHPLSPAEAYLQDVIKRMLAKDLGHRPDDILAPLYHFTMLSKALEPTPPQAARTSANEIVFGRVILRFVVGNIAEATTDAIVSSANFEMRMRVGVGEALRLKGGEIIEEEATRNGEQPLGSCVRTGPGALSTKHVFHAVSAWNECSCVGRAFARALLLAEENSCISLSAPALGTGYARVSMEMCASAMMTTLRRHVMLGGMRLRELTIWFDSDAKRVIYQDVAEEVLGILQARHFGPSDIGLPDERMAATGDAATCVDPDSM
ncbi:MAG: serine/threonine-protein kinase [Labilithrix sp.]